MISILTHPFVEPAAVIKNSPDSASVNLILLTQLTLQPHNKTSGLTV